VSLPISQTLRHLIGSARAEAERRGHEEINAEHLLLALTKQRSRVSVRILERVGVSVDYVQREMEWFLDSPLRVERHEASRMLLPSSADNAIQYGGDAARDLGDDSVRDEHFLLGLLRNLDEEDFAFRIWAELGVDGNAIGAAIPRERAWRLEVPGWLAWKEGTVGAIARSISDEQNWSGLPVLADALEEAGCKDQEVLDHLREMGSHPCRTELPSGCWVLNGLLAVVAELPADEPPRKAWWRFWK
jgi:ATP-dependent Clp protease ATP-binding subunit ClpA